MAEQVDSDNDDDLIDVLDIPNLAQLLIPAPSDEIPRTDGGQRLATPPSADQSHALDLQHMDAIDQALADPMNPADYMTKPFNRVPKLTMSLLQCLTTQPTLSVLITLTNLTSFTMSPMSHMNPFPLLGCPIPNCHPSLITLLWRIPHQLMITDTSTTIISAKFCIIFPAYLPFVHISVTSYAHLTMNLPVSCPFFNKRISTFAKCLRINDFKHVLTSLPVYHLHQALCLLVTSRIALTALQVLTAVHLLTRRTPPSILGPI